MTLPENTLRCDPAVLHTHTPTRLHLHSLLTEMSQQPRRSAVVSSVGVKGLVHRHRRIQLSHKRTSCHLGSPEVSPVKS